MVVATFEGAVDGGFLGAPGDPKVIVITVDNFRNEFRRVSDGGLILGGDVSFGDVSSDPRQAAFVVNFGVGGRGTLPSELRRTSDASVIRVLDGLASGVTFSPDLDSQRVVVTYGEEGERRSELRRTSDGVVLARFPGDNSIEFSPDPESRYFVVRHQIDAGELRRSVDGSIVATLAGTFGEGGAVAFSDDGSILTVGFDGAPISQIIRTSTGEVVAALDGEVWSATYGPGDGPVLVQYVDGGAELFSTRDGRSMAKSAESLLFPDRTFVSDSGWTILRDPLLGPDGASSPNDGRARRGPVLERHVPAARPGPVRRGTGYVIRAVDLSRRAIANCGRPRIWHLSSGWAAPTWLASMSWLSPTSKGSLPTGSSGPMRPTTRTDSSSTTASTPLRSDGWQTRRSSGRCPDRFSVAWSTARTGGWRSYDQGHPRASSSDSPKAR